MELAYKYLRELFLWYLKMYNLKQQTDSSCQTNKDLKDEENDMSECWELGTSINN